MARVDRRYDARECACGTRVLHPLSAQYVCLNVKYDAAGAYVGADSLLHTDEDTAVMCAWDTAVGCAAGNNLDKDTVVWSTDGSALPSCLSNSAKWAMLGYWAAAADASPAVRRGVGYHVVDRVSVCGCRHTSRAAEVRRLRQKAEAAAEPRKRVREERDGDGDGEEDAAEDVALRGKVRRESSTRTIE